MNKAYMISAMHSGAGKTSITMGILRYLVNLGYDVRAFKTGPDYIDSAYHSMITKKPCINLDPYFTEPEKGNNRLKEQLDIYGKDSDISIIEGAMGYHDGIYLQEPRGSAMAAAEAIDCEVCLIADTDKTPEIKEYIEKFTDSHPQMIRTIILNRCSRDKYQKIKKEVEEITGIRVIGYLEEDDRLSIPSRHLGLNMPDEKHCERLSSLLLEKLEKTVDLSYFTESISKDRSKEPVNIRTESVDTSAVPVFRIGMAKDEAFCFMYEDNLTLLKKYGAEIIDFSPLNDDRIPEYIDGLWLCGGYPEIFADKLSLNLSMMKSIREAHRNGMPIIAECGGFMYLHDSLEGIDGKNHKMCGIIKAHSFNRGKLTRFGYIEITSGNDNILLDKGDTFRSHEFHHWDSEDTGNNCHAVKASGTGEWDAIHAEDNLFCGYPHLYLRSNEKMAEKLAASCIKYRKAKTHGNRK